MPRHRMKRSDRLPWIFIAAALGLTNTAVHALSADPPQAMPVASPVSEISPAPAVSAVESGAPDAEKILDRFIEVTGGAEARAAIHNRVMQGVIEFVGMGIEARVLVWQAEPARFYAVRRTDGLGLVEEGSDGNVAWSASLTQGPEVARAALRAYKLRAYRLNADLHWRTLYPRVEYAGRTKLGPLECHQIIKHPADGFPETSYYAVDSGLLIRTDVTIPTPMGDIPTQTVYQDYRPVGGLTVGGVTVAHREIIRTMGREQRLTYEQITYNAEIPADRFDLPADIRMLAARYSTATTAAALPANP